MAKRLTEVLTVLTVLLVSAGCSIDPFSGSGEPNGSIYVTALSSTGVEIQGAAVILDDVERPERTPAYLHGISVGERTVVVRWFGFWNDTSMVTVTAGDTVQVEAELWSVPADQEGWLNFDAQPAGGRLLVNGRGYTSDDGTVLAPALVRFPWGGYRVSSHLEGYATATPLLPFVEIAAGETAGISFVHEVRQTAQQVGALPFGFTLENVEGDSVSLWDLTGYVVLLNFWYVDCQPCIDEFPGIEAVYRLRAAEDFRVLAVNPMWPDDRGDVIRLRDELGLTFQLLLDWDRHVSITLYSVSSYPRNILIDRTGTIHAVMQRVTEEELDELVAELLNRGHEGG